MLFWCVEYQSGGVAAVMSAASGAPAYPFDLFRQAERQSNRTSAAANWQVVALLLAWSKDVGLYRDPKLRLIRRKPQTIAWPL